MYANIMNLMQYLLLHIIEQVTYSCLPIVDIYFGISCNVADPGLMIVAKNGTLDLS